MTRDLQVVAFNDAAARLLGVDRAALLWSRVSELRVVTDQADTFERMLAASQTAQPDVFELTLHANGDALHLKVGISAVNDLLSVTLTDVTELKRRELLGQAVVRQ